MLTDPKINVDKSTYIGTEQLTEFEAGWPDSFHSTLSRKITTMGQSKRHVKVGDSLVFDTETIYARAMGLQSSSRGIDTKSLLCHELAPVPTSIFDEHGHMREAKAKSSLKNALSVEVSTRRATSQIEAVLIDGCA